MCRDDDRGFQLYQSDPSGNYGGWKATAIGANASAAQNILKQDYKEDISLEAAVKLVIKVTAKLACLKPFPARFEPEFQPTSSSMTLLLPSLMLAISTSRDWSRLRRMQSTCLHCTTNDHCEGMHSRH